MQLSVVEQDATYVVYYREPGLNGFAVYSEALNPTVFPSGPWILVLFQGTIDGNVLPENVGKLHELGLAACRPSEGPTLCGEVIERVSINLKIGDCALK